MYKHVELPEKCKEGDHYWVNRTVFGPQGTITVCRRSGINQSKFNSQNSNLFKGLLQKVA